MNITNNGETSTIIKKRFINNSVNDSCYLKTKHYYYDEYNNIIKIVTISNNDSYEEFHYKNDKLHRLNRPAVYNKLYNDQETHKYYRNNKLHNLYNFAVMVTQDLFHEYGKYSIENKYYIDGNYYKNKNEYLLKIQNHKNNIKFILDDKYKNSKDINQVILNYYI